jgi:hypothetical protein
MDLWASVNDHAMCTAYRQSGMSAAGWLGGRIQDQFIFRTMARDEKVDRKPFTQRVKFPGVSIAFSVNITIRGQFLDRKIVNIGCVRTIN